METIELRLGEENLENIEALLAGLGEAEGGDPLTIYVDAPVTAATGPRLKRALERLLASGRRLRLEGPPHVLRFAGMVTGGLLTGPETIQVNICNACNLDCRFCWNHSPLLRKKRTTAWKRQRIDGDLFRKVLEDAAAINAGRVLFSGRGEPFLHPDIGSFLEQARDLDLPLSIETNLLPIRDTGWLLERAGPLDLVVNVSAGTPEGYVRVHPSSSESDFVTLRDRIRTLRRSMENNGPLREIRPTFIIYRDNYRELPEMIDFAVDTGSLQVYLKMMESSPDLPDLAVPTEERGRLGSLLDAAEEKATAAGVGANFPALRYQLTGEAPQTFSRDLYQRIGCYMGWYYARVTIDGEVHFCCRDKRVDRLTPERGLAAIWKSPLHRGMRVVAREMDYRRGRGFLDAKCHQCPNFSQNARIARIMGIVDDPLQRQH